MHKFITVIIYNIMHNKSSENVHLLLIRIRSFCLCTLQPSRRCIIIFRYCRVHRDDETALFLSLGVHLGRFERLFGEGPAIIFNIYLLFTDEFYAVCAYTALV